eukprot:TRINITY_DN57139_c0_g1_i1.p2 TRINITY_DN57139_c0_g1~~TRINITY_DN57139_c0_g1_i1.p2  ORF type:complete len:136 (-),score=5.85 TRINITY_DN57139_c0_g1_i1:28-435(-)
MILILQQFQFMELFMLLELCLRVFGQFVNIQSLMWYVNILIFCIYQTLGNSIVTLDVHRVQLVYFSIQNLFEFRGHLQVQYLISIKYFENQFLRSNAKLSMQFDVEQRQKKKKKKKQKRHNQENNNHNNNYNTAI